MKRKKTVLGLALLVAGIAGLWIAGPPPLESGVYVQAVTRNTAILAKVDREPRSLVAKLWEKGVPDNPRIFTEAKPTSEHAIPVDGLRPGTLHSFVLEAEGVRVGGGEFRTAPEDDSAPVRFAAVGDSGQMPWWHNMHHMGWSRLRPVLAMTQTTAQWRVARWIDQQQLSFFLHLGDLVYWRDVRPAYEDGFFRPFAGVLADTPLYALPGNHDIPRDGSPPPFESLFHAPSAAGVGRPGRNFTAAWGAVRLIGFDVVDPEWEKGPARAWLEKALTEATEPFVIVATHLPCFSVYKKRSDNPAMREGLWNLFVRNGVDLILSGDDHHYVRFKPQPATGPVQLTIGTGGKSLYDIEPDPRIVHSAKEWAYLLVEVEKLTLRVACRTGAEEPLDSFTVDRRQGALPDTLSPARRTRILELRR